MTLTPKTWLNRPFGPDPGERLADYEARLAAYAASNPVMHVDAAGLTDLEQRVASYTDGRGVRHGRSGREHATEAAVGRTAAPRPWRHSARHRGCPARCAR